ncbi:MAG: tyrosine-type recombinase/integrase [Pseudomonadota bacterium]
MYIRERMTKKFGKVFQVELCLNHKKHCNTFRRKADIFIWAAKLAKENEDYENSYELGKKLKFIELADQWITKHAEVKKSESSVRKDKQMLRQYILPEFGEFNVCKITSEMIDDYVVILQKNTNLSNASINQHLAIMKTIFNYALNRKKYVKYNPVTSVDLLRVEPKKIDYWQIDEANRFLEANRNSNYFLLYMVALNTGMREGELLALKWDTIDFENNIITVCRTFQQCTNSIKDTTKSHKIRYIGINNEIYNLLLEANNQNAGKKELVFGNKNDRVPSPSTFTQKIFTKDIEKANVKKICFHDLRHTFATNYIIEGGNISDLQMILGHHELTTTKIYIHLEKNYLVSKMNVVKFGKDPEKFDENVIPINFKKESQI